MDLSWESYTRALGNEASKNWRNTPSEKERLRFTNMINHEDLCWISVVITERLGDVTDCRTCVLFSEFVVEEPVQNSQPQVCNDIA